MLGSIWVRVQGGKVRRTVIREDPIIFHRSKGQVVYFVLFHGNSIITPWVAFYLSQNMYANVL